MKRSSGVLMHLSSLYGNYSVGSFGEEAKHFIDFLCESGFSYWQVLPFCMPDECNSPYKSYSAFGANPWFIDLPSLYEQGLITADELSRAEQRTPYLAEYDRFSERMELLSLAASRILDRSEIIAFTESRAEYRRAAEFLALREANSNLPWQEWTILDAPTDRLFIYQFIQYEFFRQWKAIHEYAGSRGIKIIGDVPIYVALDSADVYYHREEFMLDSKGYPTSVAGVPPDYFCEDGQLWGNPLYNYKKMKSDGFAWWKTRVEYMLELFDGVRIDHFRGFEYFYSIPYGAKSAKCGKWVKAPGREIIKAIKSVTKDALVIAEDLGDITPEVSALLKFSGLPGMRVFQFAFLGDRNSTHLPHNYTENSVAYSGTHDNNTLLGYVWELTPETRREVFDYVGERTEDFTFGVESIVKTVMRSSCALAIFPIQDILCFGSDTRMNTPGKAEGNWGYRITREQLDGIDRKKLYKMNDIYRRI